MPVAFTSSRLLLAVPVSVTFLAPVMLVKPRPEPATVAERLMVSMFWMAAGVSKAPDVNVASRTSASVVEPSTSASSAFRVPAPAVTFSLPEVNLKSDLMRPPFLNEEAVSA